MLVTEAIAQLGHVSIEAPEGGPDVHLQLPSGRAVWVEVTYVHPRFEKQDRVADLVVDWLRKAVEKRFGPETQLGVEYRNDEMKPAGPTLRLPQENE